MAVASITVNYTFIAIAGVSTAIASYAGTFLMNKIPVTIFKPILFFLIAALTIYTIFKNSKFWSMCSIIIMCNNWKSKTKSMHYTKSNCIWMNKYF